MNALVVCIALTIAQAAPAGDPDLADAVRKLVRQLDAAQLTARDEADRKLLELGPAALPHLPPVTERTSAETGGRLNRLREKLLRAQALAAAQPTLVSLQGDDLPLAEVLAEISKQTGNPITDHREAFGQRADPLRVKANFDKTPYWRALDQVLDQAGLTVYGFAGQRGTFLVRRPPGTRPRAEKAHYAGMFRLEPLEFTAQRDLRSPEQSSLRFSLEVSWEPRLQPFAIVQPLGDVTAVGPAREVIAVTQPDAEPETLVRPNIAAVELEIPLELPPRDVDRIATLKGKLVALVPGPLEEFRFAELPLADKKPRPKPREQSQAGTTVTIDAVRKNSDVWEVALRMKVEAPTTALESHRGWVFENQAYFIDAAGNKIEPGGLEQTRQNKDEIGINYVFDLPDGPDKLVFVYQTPLVVLELPIEFEFRDLPLP